jgi:hypothetical protein
MEQPRRNIELKAHDPDPDCSLEVCRTLGAEDNGEIWQRGPQPVDRLFSAMRAW